MVDFSDHEIPFTADFPMTTSISFGDFHGFSIPGGQASNGGKACGTRYPDPPLALEVREQCDRLMKGVPCNSNNYNGDLMVI